MSPPLSIFQRGGWGRLKSKEPQILSEVALVIGGVSLIGWTLHLYPAFDITAHSPASRPTLSSSAADRQISAAQSHLASHPDDFNTYIALALAHYQKGPDHYIEAVNALEKARSLGATSENLFFYAGVMYEALGLPDYAINELSKYLRHHPNDYETMIRLGNLYFRQKQLDEAQAMYKQALHMWPKDATAWFNYAMINKERANYDLALSNLDQAVQIAGRLPAGGSYQKGEIYRLQGNNTQALTFYQQELGRQPNYIPAYEALESIAKAQGDQKQARELRKRINDVKKQQIAQQKASQLTPAPGQTVPVRPPAPQPKLPAAAPEPNPVQSPPPPAQPPALPAAVPASTGATILTPSTTVPVSTGDING